MSSHVVISLLILLGTPVLVVLFMVIRAGVKRARRALARQKPFPRDWQVLLKKELAPYCRLKATEQAQLHAEINQFLAEKRFEGCGGLELTDEMRVLVAAQACLLILNRPTRSYPRLTTVLMYPSHYTSEAASADGTVSEQTRLGESWGSGTVVLAWDSVRGGVTNFDDGHNVTMHEFAHQLDQEDGSADGAPILEQRTAYREWAKVLGHDYTDLVADSKRGRRTVMDRYGATDPAEFFAVATETFFEKPEQLSEKHPELFEELRDYYHLDPREWEERAR